MPKFNGPRPPTPKFWPTPFFWRATKFVDPCHPRHFFWPNPYFMDSRHPHCPCYPHYPRCLVDSFVTKVDSWTTSILGNSQVKYIYKYIHEIKQTEALKHMLKSFQDHSETSLFRATVLDVKSLGIFIKTLILNKSSNQRCSIKKVVLKNFAKFTEKHLCWSLRLAILFLYRIALDDRFWLIM